MSQFPEEINSETIFDRAPATTVAGGEPEWVLDKSEADGTLYWRREEPGKASRVTFRNNVEVREYVPDNEEFTETIQKNLQNDFISIFQATFVLLFVISTTAALPLYFLQ